MKTELTTIDKYTVKAMLEDNISPQDVATQLDYTLESIEAYAKVLEKIKAKAKSKKKGGTPPKKTVKPVTAKDLMVNRTQNGRKGVAIMTPAASMKGDDDAKAARAEPTVRSMKDKIHTIYKEEN